MSCKQSHKEKDTLSALEALLNIEYHLTLICQKNNLSNINVLEVSKIYSALIIAVFKKTVSITGCKDAKRRARF